MAFVEVPKVMTVFQGQVLTPVLVIVMGDAPRATNAVQLMPEEQETVVVATEARVVNPPVFEMYASCEMAMSEVVAMSLRPVVEMVTFPVAPETAMPAPATFESTPALLKEVPS